MHTVHGKVSWCCEPTPEVNREHCRLSLQEYTGAFGSGLTISVPQLFHLAMRETQTISARWPKCPLETTRSYECARDLTYCKYAVKPKHVHGSSRRPRKVCPNVSFRLSPSSAPRYELAKNHSTVLRCVQNVAANTERQCKSICFPDQTPLPATLMYLHRSLSKESLS